MAERNLACPPLPEALDRRFEAVVFDWDGTAVSDRRADASGVRALVEALSAVGVDTFVVSGTHLDNVDGQLQARPYGPGRVYLCLNRGSEVVALDRDGARLVHRRQPSPDEDRRLSAAADLTVERLAELGLTAEVVSHRLNRRKIDLIPLPEWADPPKARIADLLVAVERRLRRAGIGSLGEAARIAKAAARDAGLADARVTSDAKHVEIGLTDKSDSARWAFRDLADRGIGSGLVLIAGDEFGLLGGLPGSDSLMLIPEATRAAALSVGVEPGGVPSGVAWLPGGPQRFVRVLEGQLQRRREGGIPEIDQDPGWTYTVVGFDEESERAQESLLSLADGRFGTAGAPIDDHPATSPRVLAAGIYIGEGPATALSPGPLWDRSGRSFARGDGLRRTLDLRTGVLAEECSSRRSHRRVLRFSSLARPGTVVLRAEGSKRLVPAADPLGAPLGPPIECGVVDGRPWMGIRAGGGGIVAAASEARTAGNHIARLDRLGAYISDPIRPPAHGEALRAVQQAEATGFDRLLVEQRAAWARRWADADIRIEGEDELQRSVRFALFHLMASVSDAGEAAVGARGISGPAYRGHVFWDSDVFVMPFLAATHPAAARAMLEYRLRRLPAAREAATALGRQGARFPWESAQTGVDVTPRSFVDHTGREVEIRAGQLEEHIVADVAWAALMYVAWTGDRDFADGPARTVLLETARYWASRMEVGNDGRGHIRGVMGPDEYHEPVDDNAFTNVMARWNLRQAARLANAPPEERRRWRDLARRLVDGYDPRTRLYEQFTGFWQLERLVIKEMAPRRPVAADILLGPDRVAHAQVVKQADVLMLHHMVPSSTAAGSLAPNLAFYEPRTAHGSSLSPGVHAALLARAGRLDEALATLRLTASLDLDDLTGTTAGGLHLAAMGSVWQALVHGFAGIRAGPRALVIDPRLPSTWAALEIPLRYHGGRVRVRLEPGSVLLEADRPVPIRFPGHRAVHVAAGTARFRRGTSGWQEVRP